MAATQGERPGLGPWGGLGLVAGSMLGVGIFIAPPEVAKHVASPTEFLALWLVGGLCALAGAVCLAELGRRWPRSGGDYAYLRLAWPRGLAFAAGWLQLLAIFPGSLASVAVATSAYQLPMILGFDPAQVIALGPLELPLTHGIAMLLIVGMTWVNARGLQLASIAQLTLSLLPLGLLLAMSVWVLVGAAEPARTSAAASESTQGGVGEWVFAYLPVYFAYSGWNAALYLGAEIEAPEKNLGRALVGGTLAVSAVYLALCAGYLSLFGVGGLAELVEAGSASAERLFGSAALLGVALLIHSAMLGSLNASVMTGARVVMVMGEEGDAPSRLAERDDRGTPKAALYLQAALSLALVATGADVDALISYTTAAMLLTGSLTVWSLARLEPRLLRGRPLFTSAMAIFLLSNATVLAVLAWKGDASVQFAALWFVGSWLVYRLLIGAQGSRR